MLGFKASSIDHAGRFSLDDLVFPVISGKRFLPVSVAATYVKVEGEGFTVFGHMDGPQGARHPCGCQGKPHELGFAGQSLVQGERRDLVWGLSKGKDVVGEWV